MTLTTTLVILGGVVLLALAVHAWWSLRRAQPRQGSPAQTEPERVEPPMHTPDLGPAAASLDLRSSPARRVPRLDALIDAIVTLSLESPISGEAALQQLQPTRHAGTKPFYVEGLDTETGTWESLAIGRRYGELQAGVQLANRSGALNEIEFSEFVQIIEGFAEAVGARADIPNMLEVVARARELDGLAAPLDAQLSITLRSNGVAWAVGFVQQVALRLGLVSGGVAGRWVLAAEEEAAPPMLVLSVDAQAALAEDPQAAIVRDCRLALDVPQTPASVEPFPAWHLMSKQLSDDLDATAIDDHGQPITLHEFDSIGKEIDELYRKLERLDLPAGSPAARRLFS